MNDMSPSAGKIAVEADQQRIKNLKLQVNDLENRLAKTEFESQVVVDWADHYV